VSSYAGGRSEALPWWLVLVEGIVVALLGLILLVAPGASLVFLVWLLGIYLLVAFQGGGWGMGALSVLGILFGLFLVFNPLIGVATLTLILAIFMLIGGVAAIVQAFRMRGAAAAAQRSRRARLGPRRPK